MTSTCKIIVDSLSSLGSKLTSVLALNDGLLTGSQRGICRGLNKQIQVTLFNFTFFRPLSDCLNKWIVIEDENWQSLVVQIQTTIEEAAKKVKPEDVDKVWRDICEIMEERELQADQETTCFLFKRWTNAPNPWRATNLLFVLIALNSKILLLMPEIDRLHTTYISRTRPCETFSCKELGFGWLVSSSCSCLSKIEPESIGLANHLEVLELRRNLSDLQIFLDGLSHIPGIEDITDKVAFVAFGALLLACRWWVCKHRVFTVEYGNRYNKATMYLRKMISADNSVTLDQVLGLLKSLKAIDHSLFSEKAIEFAQYILPYEIGFVEFTREIGSSAITISTQIQMEPQELQSILIFSPHFKQLILEIERSLSCWLPEDGPLIINLLANVCLMRVEAIFIQRIRYRGSFGYHFNISGKWKFQYSKEWAEESRENVNQILKFLDEVVLLRDIPVPNIPYPETIVECSILLKVQFFKLKRELEKYNGNSKFSLKDKVQFFQDWSAFLINCFGRYKEHTEQYNNTCRKYEVGIKSMVNTVVSSCSSFLNHNYISDEMVESVDPVFSSLLDDIKNIMAGTAEELCPPVRISNLPKTNALGFYGILLGKIHELMNCKARLFISLVFAKFNPVFNIQSVDNPISKPWNFLA